MSHSHSLRPLAPVAMVFVLLIMMMWWALSGYMEHREHPNAGLAAQSVGGVVILRRSSDGSFRAPGTINSVPVNFVVDTGASMVAISGRMGDRLGLSRGRRIVVQTAAGPHTAYTTRFRHVALGPIVMDNVPGAIVPGMGGHEALLGMSFLRNLDMRISGERMRLH